MGVAIVLNGCDFSAKNLGKVTFLQEPEVTGISIIGNSSITGMSTTYSARYLPANTNQRSCTWSIASGSEYASIDSATGVLTIKSAAATAQQVTIKATSVYNSAITATKTVSVTYKETVDELTGISITGPDTAGLAGAQYSIIYNPANTSKTGVMWSVTSGSSCASIDQDGNLTVTAMGSVTIQAVSTFDASIMAAKTVAVTNSHPAIHFAFMDGGLKTLKTDIVVPDLSAAEMEVCFIRRVSNAVLGFGSRDSSSATNRFMLAVTSQGRYNVMFGKSQTGDIGDLGTSAHTFVINKDGYKIDGVQMSYTTTGELATTNEAPICLVNVYNNGTSAWQSFSGGGRVAYLKIRENGVLTHDLEPYTDGTDFGFEDVVTGKKYSLAGYAVHGYRYMDDFNAL